MFRTLVSFDFLTRWQVALCFDPVWVGVFHTSDQYGHALYFGIIPGFPLRLSRFHLCECCGGVK
jgi:hypothetical protein